MPVLARRVPAASLTGRLQAWRVGLAGLLAAASLALLGFVGPVALALVLAAHGESRGPRQVDDVLQAFAGQGYDLAAVARGDRAAPRRFLGRLPPDWRDIAAPARRKRAFVMVILPLVLRENEAILSDRARLRALEARRAKGRKVSRRELAWLASLAAAYEVEPGDRRELLERVDIVPPSLAIAQAAMESGWGTSRFATEGNALFGEWTVEDGRAMIPLGRDAGRTYAIRRFATLGQSVASYMRNLNTHRAYAAFRARRAELRRNGRALDGAALVDDLEAYSARGSAYVRAVRGLIAKNDLGALDRASLAAEIY